MRKAYMPMMQLLRVPGNGNALSSLPHCLTYLKWSSHA